MIEEDVTRPHEDCDPGRDADRRTDPASGREPGHDGERVQHCGRNLGHEGAPEREQATGEDRRARRPRHDRLRVDDVRIEELDVRKQVAREVPSGAERHRDGDRSIDEKCKEEERRNRTWTVREPHECAPAADDRLRERWHARSVSPVSPGLYAPVLRSAALSEMPTQPEISVVIPCLNEEEAVGRVVDQAWEGIRRAGRAGEVVVVDNGSTDRSAEVAAAHGARIVTESRRGYGNAYLTGLAAARGYVSGHGRCRRDLPAPGARALRRRARERQRSRDGLPVQGANPRRRDAVSQPVRREPHPHGDAQCLLRREGLRRPLRHACHPERRGRAARAPRHRHGVRLRDGLQGIPPWVLGQRDPDRLLPARRRVEAQPLRRRVAPRSLHAPLQPELALSLARQRSCSSSDSRE